MNFVQIIATLRKFGNYLAGLFPALTVIVDFFSKQLRRLVENPVVAPGWTKLSNNPSAKSFWKLIERFYWRTYSKDRLDLEEAPPATLGVLRPLFQICAFLCILIPLTQFNFYPVDIEAFSGFKGTAPAWSVLLWLLCLPFAWAALLVGTAISNRIAFSLTAMAAANFIITCVVLLPRSYFNSLLPASILIALGLCERTLPRDALRSKVMSVVNAIVAGSSAAIPLIILTPLRPFLGTIIKLPGPVISIGGGALLGTVLGLIALAWARLPQAPARPLFFRGGAISLSGCVWTIVVLLTGFLLAGTARGSLGQSGGQLISSLALTTSYMWPIWYFIGIGILHKLMGSSKTVATAIEGMFPRFILAPLLVLGLLAGLFIAFSERICLALSGLPGNVPNPLLPVFFQIYTWTKPMIWSNPLNVMSVHWLSWVLLFDFVVAIILAVQKRLNSAALVRLLFLTSLSGLLIWEYVFQMSSFARAPGHSVLGLFLFAIWLLWLMHTVGWGLSSKSSPCWPSAGRLAIYSGLATIALLDIHARSACQDFKLMNELFLTMFRGVIDVGLPYYFLVWTSRRVENIPVKISTLLGLFSLGALTSFAFNVLEKFAGSGWSVSALMQLAQAQYQQMQSTGSPNIDLIVPPMFFAVRAAIYVALLVLVFIISKKRLGESSGSSILFILVAFASGIASFSKTLLELPIPGEMRALIAPSSQELLFNCNLFQSYLSYWIPALLLGVSQIGSQSKAKTFFLLAPVAVALHFAVSWLYGEHEVFLRACGSLYTVMTIIGGIFVILVTAALGRIQKSQPETQPVVSDATLLTPRMVVSLVIALEMILIPLAITTSALKLENRKAADFSHQVSLPASWTEQLAAPEEPVNPADRTISTYLRPAASFGNSILQIGTVPSDPGGTQELLKQLLLKAAQSKLYPNLTVVNIESWGRYCPGALACSFAYDTLDKMPVPRAGLTVLIPRKDGRTEFYTVHTNPSDIDREQSELALIIRNLRRVELK
jgi:hypothetical protein